MKYSKTTNLLFKELTTDRFPAAPNDALNNVIPLI